MLRKAFLRNLWVRLLRNGMKLNVGKGNGNPLQYSCWDIPMDRGAWWAIVHGVAKNQTRLSDEHTHTWSLIRFIKDLQRELYLQKHYQLGFKGTARTKWSLWASKVVESMKQSVETAAAAAAKSLQSCPTLCDPIDISPPGSAVSGILQARTLKWVAISFSIAWKWKVKMKSFSRVRLIATPWTAAYQASPSLGFSRQEYWSGVPLPSPL